MGNTKKPMRIASFKLPEDLDRTLTELAKARHTSRSALVREALEQFTATTTRSVTVMAGALVGCLEGPADLSTGAKHMEGFGE
jgi:hypothetical protein